MALLPIMGIYDVSGRSVLFLPDVHLVANRAFAIAAALFGAVMSRQSPAHGLPALMLRLYELPVAELPQSRHFQSLRSQGHDKEILLESIPLTSQSSLRPLHLLYALLTEVSGAWPATALIKCHTRLTKLVPEKLQGHPDEPLVWVVDATTKLVKQSYGSFLDFLGQEQRPALRTPNPDNYITHHGLYKFIANFHLPVQGSATRKPVVAIALPNGPLLAATCMAVTNFYIAAPINPAAGAEQFKADILQAGAKCILTTASDYQKLQLGDPWVEREGIEILLVNWTQGDDIKIRTRTRSGSKNSITKRAAKPTPNQADDIGLILFTSGTSGTKKVVPLTMHSIIAGIIFVIESWGLTKSDICLNMMPLYHVGGLVRNIFGPMVSGGSTVCCPAFDPTLFWDVVQEIQPTWYYASPSMHTVILAEAESRQAALDRSQIRLVCNAAGGLLPSLACQLRDTFDCVVLPSYGMTECMPISTPPLDYQLDREGTSGISTGPDLTILDWSEAPVRCGTVGRICVRGEPVFPGYLRPDGTFDKSPFNDEGWFDTGDLGYMDVDGYLYITGRSKEVINRGGELISPFEVENAIVSSAMLSDSPIYGRVTQALAFSACHDVLQEVVGVVLVTPPNMPRVDLKTLHAALRSSLQQVKWPVLITYMSDLPKKNNKVLRIKLGQRLGLPEVTDDMPYLAKHWEAVCPPTDTALSVPIECSPCTVSAQSLAQCLDTVTPASHRHHVRPHDADDSLMAFLAPSKPGTGSLAPNVIEDIRHQMLGLVHNYMIPDQLHVMPDPFVTNAKGVVDEEKLQAALDQLVGASLKELDATTEGKVTKAFAEVLGCPTSDVPRDSDFFSLGGDSLRAGRLVSAIRAMFDIQLPINLIFNNGTVEAIASHLDQNLKTSKSVRGKDNVIGHSKSNSSTNPLLMLIQLIPLTILYPMRRGFQWTTFILLLSFSQEWPTNTSVVGRLFNLTLSILIARLLIRIVAPFFGILAKWVIIGRYREGLYPMWGMYHTRWWLVEKIVSICGKGFFNSSDMTKRVYCRLMGAKIGKNVKLAGASLGEWDLLDIRDGATLTRCVCRPFAAEGNASMYLGRILIGENCFVGISSIIAAGSRIPPGTCIGMNSSSWELKDADEGNRDNSPSAAPKPHWLLTALFTYPLSLIAWFLTLLPWLGGLVGMVIHQPLSHHSPLRDILDWFTDAERVAYHYLALVLRCLFSPFILFGVTVFIKLVLDLFFGKLKPGPAHGRGAIATWRGVLIKTLLPVSRLHEVTGMFGQHYEATSVAIRMLGGKIGKRVYWPGTGPGIGDYHLLDIGNDVVFGSRAHLITSDGLGSDPITIRDRAMIADRVSILPGVDIGERTTMGSGALTRRGKAYPSGGTYVGSKGGDAVCLTTSKDVVHEKQSFKNRLHELSSEETLSGAQTFRKKSATRAAIQHMSSDDTLADSREAAQRHRQEIITDPFASDSESEDNIGFPGTGDMSPFGRAFYLKLAPYHVFGSFTIFCYSSFIAVFTAFYWNVPSISSIQIVDVLLDKFIPRDTSLWVDVAALYVLSTVTIAILTTLQAILAITIVILAKWILLGRRQPGNYDWDKSSYCQRWQLFLCIEKLRRYCYRGHGILGFLTGTSWIVLYFRALGAKIGKDCALFANGRPSLMFTEPDLITIGDRVAIDDASVVAHINTRGKFDLNRLQIGNRCVLRSGSRLLSGATMKDDSCLLEHTLIMGGDMVEEKWTMQGWPAERFTSRRVGKLRP